MRVLEEEEEKKKENWQKKRSPEYVIASNEDHKPVKNKQNSSSDVQMKPTS